MAASRPVWGAWIEMWTCLDYAALGGKSRPVWGAWIEILGYYWRDCPCWSRAPYGARGLKSLCDRCIPFPPYVAPRMGHVD